MTYLKQTIKGVSWMGVLRVVTRALVTLRLAILARIFAPSDFGAFAIATLVLAFFEVITETGINVYLIQEKKKISKFLNEAWIVSIGRGLLIALLILLSAKPISVFFDTPDAFVLILLAALIPFIKGFINPSIILFQKDLKFRKEFVFRSIILAFESISMVILALITKSVSSLILGFVVGAIVEVLLSFLFVRPWPGIRIKMDTVKDIFHRGKWVTMFGIFGYLAREGDNAVVGRLLGASSLGIYQMGYRISTLVITEISEVVSRVTFPIYAKLNGDRKRLLKAYIKSTVTISIVSVTVSIPLLFFTEEVVKLVLGEQWMGAVVVIKILTFYGLIRSIVGYAPTLFLAVKKQQFAAYMTFSRFLGLGIFVLPLTLMYGIEGASVAALISALFEIPVAILGFKSIFARKRVDM